MATNGRIAGISGICGGLSGPTGSDRLWRLAYILGLVAALFGIGWGLAGICPGPAITAAEAGVTEVYIFLSAMLARMAGWRWLVR